MDVFEDWDGPKLFDYALRIFESEQEAEALLDEFPVGMYLNDEEVPLPIDFRRLSIGDPSALNRLFTAGKDTKDQSVDSR